MESSPHVRHGRTRLVVSTGTFLVALLVAGAPAALAQVGYTGVPTSPPPGDVYVEPVYVDPYTGVGAPSPVVAARLPAVAPQRRPAGVMSVDTRSLDDLRPASEPTAGRLVTGWDLVTLAGLGLTAVVAFGVSAGRVRAR